MLKRYSKKVKKIFKNVEYMLKNLLRCLIKFLNLKVLKKPLDIFKRW